MMTKRNRWIQRTLGAWVLSMALHSQATTPVIVIDTPDQVVPFEQTCVDLAGSSTNISGELIWTNTLNGLSSPVTGVTNWTASCVDLSVGVNPILVLGTNSVGIFATNTVTIKRFSKITPNLTVYYDFEGDFNDHPGAGVTNDDLTTVTGGSLTSNVPTNARGSTQAYTFDNRVTYQTAQTDAFSPDLASADQYTIMYWFKGDDLLQDHQNTRLVTVRYKEGGANAANPAFQVEGFGQGFENRMDTRLNDPLNPAGQNLWFLPDAVGVLGSDGIASNDAWHHVAFVLSNRGGPNTGGAYGETYVDGVSLGVAEGTKAAPYASTGNPIGNTEGELILGGIVSRSLSATGSIDDFALYEGVVSPSMIQRIASGAMSPGEPHALAVTPTSLYATDPTFDIDIAFSEPVSNFNSAADLEIIHNGSTNTGVTITGSNATYTVTLTGLSGVGTFTMAVSTNSNVISLTGVPLGGSDLSPIVTVDFVEPSATNITLIGSNPTPAQSVSFDVTFDETVVNFDSSADLTINHAGTTNTGVVISGSGANYSVQLTGVSGDGTFTLAVSTNSSVTDLAGNALSSSPTSVVVTHFTDTVPPTVLSITPDTLGPVASTGLVEYTVVFSEAVIGFYTSMGGGVGIMATNIDEEPYLSEPVSSNSITYTFSAADWVLANGVSNGAISLYVSLSNGVTDVAGNLLESSVTSAVVTVSASFYQLWAINAGITNAFNYREDPDHDGRINGHEYMRDGDPLSPYDSIKQAFHVESVNGTNYAVLTMAAPDDAVYEKWAGELYTDYCPDNSICMWEIINVTTNLANPTYTNSQFEVIEDPSISSPAGMPALSPSFSYRHFRFTTPIDELPVGYFVIDTFDDD